MDPATFWVVVVGRLKAGVLIGQAQEEASAIFRNETVRGAKPILKEADEPAIKPARAQQGLNGESRLIAPMLYVISAAVGLVLLIACANVAGLMLARGARRQKEMALRLALGAARRRIVRQLLTGSVLLSMLGGALGTLVAVWAVQSITGFISSAFGEGFPYVIAPDWRVLMFTIGVMFATGILFGLAPARNGARADLNAGLKENGLFLTARGHKEQKFRPGDALVMAQVGLSVVALTGAGLLVRTLHNLQQLNPGFDSRNILLFGINPPIAGYKDEQSAQLYRDLQERFAVLPGVISASYSEKALVSGSWSAEHVHLDGAPPKSNISTAVLAVGPNFFSTMGIPVIAGRTLTPADFASAAATNAARKAAESAEAAGTATGKTARKEAVPVPVMVNELFARKYFANQNPVGKHIGDREEDEPAKGPQPGYSIVGVTGNTKYTYLRRKLAPTMYLPLVGSGAHFELRTSGNPTALVAVVRDVVARADKNLPLFGVRTQTEQIEETLFQERVMTRVATFFRALALLLACIGLYGLLSYEVTRRTRELGIRMALGAERSNVLRVIVGRGILLVAVGATAGVGTALGVTRFMASMLYDVRANDPTTIVGVALLLGLVAACWIPARRAMRVDPMVALRYE